MINENDIHLTQKNEILNIVSRALSYIDPRLIDHGERVAFIVQDIIAASPEHYSKINNDDIFILSLLHDIGAYKTEEIDNMVVFETKDVMKHAAYGYVF